MAYERDGWGCPDCGIIYVDMPLEKKHYCDTEWTKVTVEYDETGKIAYEEWYLEETWSKEHLRLEGKINE